MIKCYKLDGNEWLKGLFDERHRWVHGYVRDTFWAGMSTTQRSENMNSFFDGYVNSKATLKQFVEQYNNALKNKIEKESIADFSSFNTKIACISYFGFETQFQKAFTNAKFEEFQIEVASMMYCHAFFDRTDCLNSTVYVIESKKVHDKVKDMNFKALFNEKDFEIQCTCCLFEFKGILCRHILCLLKLTDKTESVSSSYVMSIWRNDIKRRHTLIKCGFDPLVENVELQRVSKACDAFYEVASVEIETEDYLLKVMNWIKDLKIELTCKQRSPEIIERDNLVQKHVTKILDPAVTRSKGRPPAKRKACKVDQIMKKKTIKSNNYQSQEEEPCISKVQESEEFSLYQTIDVNCISTQESVQCGQSYFRGNRYDASKNPAPFNPNLKYLNDVKKVQDSIYAHPSL